MSIFHKLLKSSFTSYEARKEKRKECQAIQKKISSNLRCASGANVKWLKCQNKSWQPVFIVQRSYSKWVVLDENNKLKEVKKSELKDEPEYENSAHIASHVKRSHDICSNYPWRSPVGAQCSWKDGTHWTLFSGVKDNIRTGVIERIQHLGKYETKFIVRPDDKIYTTVQLSTRTDRFK
eukprot:414689_1